MKRILLLMSMVFLLSACSTQKSGFCPMPLLGYGEFCTQDTQCRLMTLLRKEGVDVYFYGDNLYLYVYTDRLFKERQIFLKPAGEKILNDVASFLSCYQKISVRVVGYSSDLPVKRENGALSKQQANAAAEYLWNKCIKTRMIYARGGAVNPLSRQKFRQNYILIETERLP